MNPTAKQLWIDALRSGKYRKTRHSLRKSNCFCVLGVLCDVYGKKHNVKWTKEASNYYFLGYSCIFPQKVQDWLDIKSLTKSRNFDYLVTLNDSYEKTFKELADYIEEKL